MPIPDQCKIPKWQVKDSPLLVQQLQDMRQAVESLQASNARLVADDLRDRISRLGPAI